MSLNQNTKFTFSIKQLGAFLVFIISTTVSGSLIYAKLERAAIQSEMSAAQISDMQMAITKISNILDIMKKEQDKMQTDINVTKESLNTVRNELIIVNSYIKDKKK